MPLTVQVKSPSSPSCVACGGPLDSSPRELDCGPSVTGGTIVRCKSCGTNQVEPRPSPEALARLYDADYYEGFIDGAGMSGGNNEVSPVLRQRLVELERQVTGRRLLDVGCGLGWFVKLAVQRGWDAAGVEPSAWAAREGSTRNHVVIHHGDLANAAIEPASVDVVHFNHVVEHVLDPVLTLRDAKRVLRPGGVVVVEVPQELKYPLSDRVFRSLHPELYQGPRPAVTHHLIFFTVAGLRSAAERAGLTVKRIATVRHLRTDESRLPLGVPAKRLLYWTEAVLETAPVIEMWATTA